MARWYLVRHGETDWNAQQRIQGHTDVPLNETGRAEAARTGARLANIPFAAVYASDLVRTQETARIILAQRLETDTAPVLARSALRELAYGIFEGKTWTEIRDLEPSLRDRPRDRYLDWAPEGGETFRALIDRLSGFARELEERHGHDDVLVVSHGGSLRALAVALLGLPYETFPRLRGLAPASISIITHEPGIQALTAWNDMGHLLCE
ncbi:MAG: histidine phosphatase family protein [Dehalococcoidia bacterium]